MQTAVLQPPDERRPFLGVARSVTGRSWRGPDASVERGAMAIAQVTGLPEIVARLLAANGVLAEAADGYLAPTLRTTMPDPSTVADMEVAARRLTSAVSRRERIAVFGDYDVDGAASTALVVDWLRTLGQQATSYIPDRIEEGFGPNVPAMTRLGREHDLVICVDCGTAAAGPIAAARAEGADVLVVDHHLPGASLPDAIVVNPNRADDTSGLGHLCAAGVVFLLLVAANRAMRRAGAAGPQAQPDLMRLLDLVAVATVADMAPLVGLNRAFVRQGLAVFARRERPGLVALADAAGLSAPPTSGDLGFVIGPRINAGGRIGTSSLGVDLLSTQDPHEAAALAERLDALNAERRDIEAAVLDAAAAQVEQRGTTGPLVWAAGKGWHAGVVGIVASRLKERFNRPAVVIALDGDAGTGSGRSIPGVDLGSAVAALVGRDLLRRGGGHRMAAGLSVDAARLEEAMDALGRLLAAQGAADAGIRELSVLGALSPGGATVELVERLECGGPFGPSNPAPRLVFDGVVPSGVRSVGTGHCQARFGALGAIAFRAADNGIAGALEAAAASRRPLHVAGRLEVDDWGGRRKSKLTIEDVAEPS